MGQSLTEIKLSMRVVPVQGLWDLALRELTRYIRSPDARNLSGLCPDKHRYTRQIKEASPGNDVYCFILYSDG